MVDLLQIEANRIRIRDTDGTTVFDTNERPFLPLTSVSGAVGFSSRSATSNSGGIVSTSNVDDPTFIASCHPSCNVVRGAFYVAASGSFGVTGIGWFNAGGSYVHYYEANCMAAFTFYASGGAIYLHERSFLRAATPTSGTTTITMFGGTFSYKLIAGVYL